MKYLSIVVLLAVALGCKYLSSPQKLESEAATVNPSQTVASSFVFLNGEGYTTSDLNSFKNALHDVIMVREKSGVLIEGTNVAPTNVYLSAKPDLTIGAVGELYRAIDDNAGDVYIPKKNTSPDDPFSKPPNPLFLGVTTDKPGSENMMLAALPLYDSDHKYTYNTSFEFVQSDAGSLVSDRAFRGTVELSADERYFINDKQGSEADKGPKYTQIKQRPIDPAALAGELSKIIEPTNSEILIIASDKASYASLLKIFEAAPGPSIKLRVLVRR